VVHSLTFTQEKFAAQVFITLIISRFFVSSFAKQACLTVAVTLTVVVFNINSVIILIKLQIFIFSLPFSFISCSTIVANKDS